ncbi:MAG: type II toxin-antitoxin system PemK/MazF family toxin [Proteobacteria bacterium]|nr:type II toxin-antitoxin system PemK/MazF family toxin [Pseudomonadota bacterium]
MRRGDIWTIAGGKDHAGRPRPVVIVQDDSFDATGSITICAFTTDETDAPLVRLPVQPNQRNGLRAACRLMVDRITTVPKTTVGARASENWTMRTSWGSIRRHSWSSDWRSRPAPGGTRKIGYAQRSQASSELAEGVTVELPQIAGFPRLCPAPETSVFSGFRP